MKLLMTVFNVLKFFSQLNFLKLFPTTVFLYRRVVIDIVSQYYNLQSSYEFFKSACLSYLKHTWPNECTYTSFITFHMKWNWNRPWGLFHQKEANRNFLNIYANTASSTREKNLTWAKTFLEIRCF